MTSLRGVLLAIVVTGVAVVLGPGSAVVAGADPSYQVANTGGLSLNVRSAPSLHASVIGSLPAGASVVIRCQTTGDEVNGVSAIWDQLTIGGYVSDYYVDTPAVGAFSPGIPACSAPASPPASVPAAPAEPPAAAPAEPSAAGLDGVNWPDARDNYQSGWLIPTGLSASDHYGTVYAKAYGILSQFQAAGANTVRLPINPATVLNGSGTGPGWWWSQYQGAINAASDLGMNVILSYWDHTNASGNQPGTIDYGSPTHPADGPATNTNLDCSGPHSPYASFNEMWDQVIGRYAGQSNIYFEIMNEPHGYTPAGWDSIAEQWLACHPQVPRGRVIVSAADQHTRCVGPQNDLADVANDPNLDGTLLSLHYYNWCAGSDDEPAITNLLAPSYQGRVVLDEFGTSVTKGSNGPPVKFGDPNSPDPNVHYLRQLTRFLHNSGMGAVYWPGLKGCDPGDSCDAYSVWSLDANDNLSLRGNRSVLPLLRQAWGYQPVQHTTIRRRHHPLTGCRSLPTKRSRRLCRAHHRPARGRARHGRG